MRDLTYENLVVWMKQRFGYQGRAETFRAQLSLPTNRYRYRQKPTESQSDLLIEIRQLLLLAYPEQVQNPAIGRDMFIDAIADPDLSVKTRERDPQNLNDTFKIARAPIRKLYENRPRGTETVQGRIHAGEKGGNDTELLLRKLDKALSDQNQKQEKCNCSITDQMQLLTSLHEQKTSPSLIPPAENRYDLK